MFLSFTLRGSFSKNTLGRVPTCGGRWGARATSPGGPGNRLGEPTPELPRVSGARDGARDEHPAAEGGVQQSSRRPPGLGQFFRVSDAFEYIRYG